MQEHNGGAVLLREFDNDGDKSTNKFKKLYIHK